MSTEASSTVNGMKLVGEAIVPGASRLIDGDIRSGGLHLLGAIASVALIGGPAGLALSMLVRGNSFTTSTLDKPLHRALFPGRAASAEGEAEAEAAETKAKK